MVILFCLDEGSVILKGKPKTSSGGESPGVLGKVLEAGDLRALGPWHFQPYCGTEERCSQS